MKNVSVSDFARALIDGNTHVFVNLCKTRPDLILHFCDGDDECDVLREFGVSTLLNLACRECFNPRYLRYLCQTLRENAMNMNESHGEAHLNTLKLALHLGIMGSVQIMLEYGAHYNGSDDAHKNVCRTCTDQVQQKWNRCARAASTILLIRRQAGTWFHLIGHDMARVIAQEVWAHKRHEAWK